ncbi:hypothetical protein cypCar_00018481 [Cyprinus carpio]|nr:hypothetical protein cypCar_00018481 [Cyprinus carpio]
MDSKLQQASSKMKLPHESTQQSKSEGLATERENVQIEKERQFDETERKEAEQEDMKGKDMMCGQSVWSVCVWADSGRIRQKRAWIIDSFSIEEEHPGPFPYTLGKITLEKSYLVNFVLRGKGVDEDPKNILSITDTGEILVLGKVDYEKNTEPLLLKFEAINKSNNVSDTRLGLEIKILDINDHAPKFQKSVYEVTVDESHAQDKSVRTVNATDDDDSETNNGTFSFTIKSVTPKTDNVEFYIQQQKETGTIYFKGCLDYEKAQKYTVLVEAKDKGEKIQLSSTSTVIINILDNNNNLPEFSGKPIKKKEPNATWELDQIPPNSDMSVADLYNSIPVTIYVEDVNDPPVFIPPVKHVAVMENIDVGTSLTTFTAKDMDGSHVNTFIFVKGEDIDGWITVDAKTGQVSTAKILDRESPFVIDGTYIATLYAVDDGET